MERVGRLHRAIKEIELMQDLGVSFVETEVFLAYVSWMIGSVL